MSTGYWSKALSERTSRRRALAATGGFALGASLLAACGGGSSGGSGGTGKADSSLVTKAEDTSKDAKVGGVLKDVALQETQTLDPGTPQAALNLQAKYVYGTFIKEQSNRFKPADGSIRGDLAESWEVSPDQMTITMKLRQGVKFHNRAPINGRAVDTDDALFSYNRYVSTSAIAAQVVNSVNPEAPVLSLTAPDSRTLVVKLKEPNVYIFNYFGGFGSHTGNIMILPKETGAALDIRRNMVGHGPFQLNEYTPSVGFSLKRNPDYWEKDHAYVDEILQPTVSEAAARVAQFKAGNIHYMTPPPELVFTIKKEESRIGIYETPIAPASSVITFGQLPNGKSPFLDERVRQAFSMAIDRDLWIDARFNVSKFAADGLPQEIRWNSHLNADWTDWWLDPKGKDIGPNGKYFQFNLEEAKKLLTAAGYPTGFDATSHYPVQVFNLGPDAVPLDGMIQQLGIRIKLNPITDYNGEYIPKISLGQGQFDGWGYRAITGTVPIRISETSALMAMHHPSSGGSFFGYSTNGKNDKSGDPEIVALLDKARAEPNKDARKKLVHDIQRSLAKKMHSMILPGGASGFAMAWPALKNYRVYSGHLGGPFNAPASDAAYKLWLDQTKAPFV